MNSGPVTSSPKRRRTRAPLAIAFSFAVNSAAVGLVSVAMTTAPATSGAAPSASMDPDAAARSADLAREAPSASLDPEAAARFADLALSCLHREYPNKIAHVLDSEKDALPPHVLTPAFYGCYDWHSDVHGHWLLARLARLYPDAPFAVRARTEIARSLTPENMAGEV